MLLFALKTLVFDRGKFLIALVGVIFSIILVNVQMGLFLGLVRKGSILIDHTNADIWVGRRGVENIEFPYDIPELWMQRIRGLPGVHDAEPVIFDVATMTVPSGEYETVFIIGFEPSSKLGGAWDVSIGDPTNLDHPDSISIEELEAWKLGEPKIGDTVEISGRRARVVVMTRGVLTFTASPYVFTNLDSARRYAEMREGFCSYIIIKAESGTNLDALAKRIRQLIPESDVYKSREFSEKSRSFWISRTGIGISFGGATVLGLLVGLVMVAQSLYAVTLDHIGDYATLKAIGAEDRDVCMILLVQALTIAVVGISLGLTVVYMIERFETPMAEIDLPVWLVSSGIAINMLICMAASLLPLGRISRADPVMTLQG